MRLRSERIVCMEGVLAGEVVVADGRIASAGPCSSAVGAADRTGPSVTASSRAPLTPTPSSGDEEVFDLGDRWLVPGYIDPHVHGGGGAQCNTVDLEEIAAVAGFHASHGTTGLVATTVAAPVEELSCALTAIAQCRAPTLLGAHLEGPFLSPDRPGAMDPSLFLEPDLSQLERLLEAGNGAMRVMTVAPELPGALELVEVLTGAGVVVSVGHTNATDAEVRAAVDAGATAATHVFNAMPPLHHREPGAVGAVLDLKEVSCELICDGAHVDPVAMRLVLRAKGAEGVRLVTDAMAAAGMPDGEYQLGNRSVTVSHGRAVLEDGESIAGSTLTMETAVQNAVRFLGISVEDAVMMASTNSARQLGLEGRKGQIASGLDADLVVLDQRLAVQATMVAGEWVT